jgi:hypothetical protein
MQQVPTASDESVGHIRDDLTAPCREEAVFLGRLRWPRYGKGGVALLRFIRFTEPDCDNRHHGPVAVRATTSDTTCRKPFLNLTR